MSKTFKNQIFFLFYSNIRKSRSCTQSHTAGETSMSIHPKTWPLKSMQFPLFYHTSHRNIIVSVFHIITIDQIANIHWIIEKIRVPEKYLFLLYWLCQSLYCVDHNKLENSERDGNTRPPDLPLEKFVCRSGSNS